MEKLQEDLDSSQREFARKLQQQVAEWKAMREPVMTRTPAGIRVERRSRRRPDFNRLSVQVSCSSVVISSPAPPWWMDAGHFGIRLAGNKSKDVGGDLGLLRLGHAGPVGPEPATASRGTALVPERTRQVPSSRPWYRARRSWRAARAAVLVLMTIEQLERRSAPRPHDTATSLRHLPPRSRRRASATRRRVAASEGTSWPAPHPRVIPQRPDPNRRRHAHR